MTLCRESVIPESFRNTVFGNITFGFLDMCHRFGKICPSFSLYSPSPFHRAGPSVHLSPYARNTPSAVDGFFKYNKLSISNDFGTNFTVFIPKKMKQHQVHVKTCMMVVFFWMFSPHGV